jgi:uncharacterized protein YggE
MRIITLLIFLSLTTQSFSQNNSGEITASGTAKTKVKPDVAMITFVVEKQDPEESKALKNLNEEVDRLAAILNKMGFTTSHIRIARYAVSDEEDNNGSKTYVATNSLVLKFPLDNKLIDRVFSAVEEEKLKDLNLDLETMLSDSLEKAVRAQLMVMAVQNAQVSAGNIAKALGVKLGKVKHASKYGEVYQGDLRMYEMVKFTPPKGMDVAYLHDTSFKDFEVQEVEIEEQINIVYEILQGTGK